MVDVSLNIRSRLGAVFVAALVAITAVSVAAQVNPLAYPEARRIAHVTTYHGIEVTDSYQWMEDLESPELLVWMRAQDELTSRYLSDRRELVDWIADRTFSLGTFASRGIRTKRGDRSFYSQREIGQTFGTFRVEGPSGTRQLLDFEALNDGGDVNRVSSFSEDGRFVTVSHTSAQSDLRRWSRVRTLRVDDGAYLPEALAGFYGGMTNIAWAHDSEGFYYVRYPVPDDAQAPLGLPGVYYHELGTDQTQDVLLYERPDEPQLSYFLRVTQDGRYLVISVATDGGNFNGLYSRLLYLDTEDSGTEVTTLVAGIDGSVAFEGNRGDEFFLRTTLDAPNMRLMSLDLGRPDVAEWVEVIPASDYPMQSIAEIADHWVVMYVKDARTTASVFERDGRLVHEIDLMVPAMGGFADHPTDPVTYYTAPQLFDPGTIYSLDVRSEQSEVYFRPELAHDPDDFQTTQVFFESEDGTRVPMSLVHRRDIVLNGENPVFMYGYGAWAWSAFPWQGYMMPWIELGGVYAVANIRGGGEYGEAWHQDGIGRKKQNGIDDFIAAAEWLIENDYTSPGRMIANGGSASGILPAAAIVQRPDLFGAAIINYPSLDQVRYAKFGNGASWIPEFGDPEDPEDFEALFAYSPYHQLEEGVCYPPTWIQVGEKDDTTTPMHGYKFAAALQAAQRAVPGCENPALLKIAWGAGHAWGLTPEQSRETQAEELAFLVKTLGLTIPRGRLTTGGRR